MTEIIIKSFNRPYYLERCLKSIYINVKGTFKIIILDDGTPPEYLDKIMLTFPKVDIRRSALYAKKVEAINNFAYRDEPFKSFSIPVELWKEEISKATDFFLLLEDDIWFTSELDIDNLSKIASDSDIVMTKIGWSGNKNVNIGKSFPINSTVEIIEPKLPIKNELLYSLIARNKYKLKSLIYRLGIIDDHFDLPYYTLYNVASALYKRDYWLHIWQDAKNKVNENLQLSHALGWYSKYKKSKFAKTHSEVCKTSFISSATNMFENISFNIITFNHHLNQAWLAGQLDPMSNFPNDFLISDLSNILDNANDHRCTSDNWKKWVKVFKSQYIKMGCDVG